MSYSTVIQQTEDKHAPPSMQVLQVSVIGDEVVLEFCDIHETSNASTLTSTASVNVPVYDLMNALKTGRISWWGAVQRSETRAEST